jgi:hypothetical protein
MAKTEKMNPGQLKARARVLAYQKVFSSGDGKKVLQDLMANHFVMSSTATQNEYVSIEFNEGQRNVVLRIMSILKIKPEEMFNEISAASDQAPGIDW